MPLLSTVRGAYGPQGRFQAKEVLYSFTTHTFTTAGKAGRFGPTIAQMLSAYSAATWTSNPANFNIGRADGYQLWTVPATGIYEITARGAQGSYGSLTDPGLGAVITARFNLTVGQKLEMVVGQTPGDTTDNEVIAASGAAAGGGGSFVCLGSTNTPLLIAGGGGGHYTTNVGRQYRDGQNRRQPIWGAQNYSPAAQGTNPVIGYGGSGYHAGGGGGLLGAGTGYPGRTYTDAVAVTDTRGQQYTLGGSFSGSSEFGTWYATGGGMSGYTTVGGGFGGGGGGHSGNNAGGGGGGYSGGHGGQTRVGGTFNDGIGGGSFIDSSATNVATNTGTYDDLSTFNGVTIINNGLFNTLKGSITITRIA
jgi:hypothetical protein